MRSANVRNDLKLPNVCVGGYPYQCDDIRLAKNTTKRRFDNTDCKFYHGQIPKAVNMKRIPT